MPALVVALVFALHATAQVNPMLPAAPAAAVHFAKVDALDVTQLVPEPPAADSAVERAELDTLLQVQAGRTLEQVAWADVVNRADIFATVGAGGLLGENFKREKFPRFVALGREAYEDLRPVVDAAKERFSRRRPYLADPRVKPSLPLPTGDSYPSGHAFNAYLNAALLAEIFPEKRTEIFDRARYVAWGRIVAGVHYPTDLEAGRRLAEAGFAELKKSAAFRAAIEKCREEAAAAATKKAP